MENVEADERLLPDDAVAEEEEPHLLANDRRVPRDRRADRDRPEGELVPREEVAGERGEERQEEQDDADDPVELAGLLVAPREEHAAEVQEDDRDHRVRRPPVHVPEEDAERDRAREIEHAVVGLLDRRHVIEHEQDPGHEEDHEQAERHDAEAQRVRGPERVRVRLDRVDVQEEVAERRLRPAQVRGRERVAEDRGPDVRREGAEGAEEAGLGFHRVRLRPSGTFRRARRRPCPPRARRSARGRSGTTGAAGAPGRREPSPRRRTGCRGTGSRTRSRSSRSRTRGACTCSRSRPCRPRSG